MSDLTQLFDQLDAFKRPPIESWHPEKTVSIDIHIDSQGNWNYQGSKISRHRIVKLFSTVLRLEQGEYYLVTPPVKYRIRVDDVPFLAVELNRQGNGPDQQLYFRTNMDEVVLADRQHRILMMNQSNNTQPLPYIEVRDSLCAKISRPVYYELADMMQQPSGNATDQANYDQTCYGQVGYGQVGYGVFSAGIFFDLGTVTVSPI